MQNIRHLSADELKAWFTERGLQPYRARQVWEWLWSKHAHSFGDMTNLSKDLREELIQGNIKAMVESLIAENQCPALLITPVVIYAVKSGIEQFCQPLEYKL